MICGEKPIAAIFFTSCWPATSSGRRPPDQTLLALSSISPTGCVRPGLPWPEFPSGDSASLPPLRQRQSEEPFRPSPLRASPSEILFVHHFPPERLARRGYRKAYVSPHRSGLPLPLPSFFLPGYHKRSSRSRLRPPPVHFSSLRPQSATHPFPVRTAARSLSRISSACLKNIAR
jgi:hypothetical protein